MLFSFSFLILALSPFALAEDGLNAWLRYAPIPNYRLWQSSVPRLVIALNITSTSPVYTAGTELAKGLGGIFDVEVEVENQNTFKSVNTQGRYIVVGTVDAYHEDLNSLPKLKEDGYYVDTRGKRILILGQNERGALYGAFEYLNKLGQGKLGGTSYSSSPDASIRWVNQWDNLQTGGNHGSVERGYGGPSMVSSARDRSSLCCFLGLTLSTL